MTISLLFGGVPTEMYDTPVYRLTTKHIGLPIVIRMGEELLRGEVKKLIDETPVVNITHRWDESRKWFKLERMAV